MLEAQAFSIFTQLLMVYLQLYDELTNIYCLRIGLKMEFYFSKVEKNQSFLRYQSFRMIC
jgi:hypothetical protein